MTPDLLERVGIALYGQESWKARLANTLGVDKRVIQRWASGAAPIPDSLAFELGTCVYDTMNYHAAMAAELAELGEILLPMATAAANAPRTSH